MTREEAIDILAESKRQNEVMRDNPSTFWASHQMADGVKNAERRIAALNLAITALRPVSREQVERMRGEWQVCFEDWRKQIAGDQCSKCGFQHYGTSINHYHFCPACGAPITDEAVEMVMERLEALKDAES